MTDQPTMQPSDDTSAAKPADNAPLSDHAEDVLANAVGHELALESSADDATIKTVREVLSEMIDKRDELEITLEYGTGESGVDQASWGIEMASLQRAFMRRQMHDEVEALATQIENELRVVKGCIETEWIDKTREFQALKKAFEQPYVTRQEIDDFQHRIFGRNEYIAYIESVLALKDIRKLLNASGNLQQVSQQLQEDFVQLLDPNKVNYADLATAIIEAEGDIDALSIKLERDYSSAVFRRNLAEAEQFLEVINEEWLKSYKLWVHSFDLNIREVLATEKSATNGRITEKSRDQLKDMLVAGSNQIQALMRVIQ